MKVSLVFLTWNEITGLQQVFEKVPLDAVDEVLAVDGGSTDGTLEFFGSHGIRTVVQDVKGRGEAFRIAFRETTGDALIFFSPDGNEEPSDISRFRPLLEQGADLVIATRMTKEAKNEEDDQLLKWRKWANNAFTLLANVAWNRSGRYVTDTINGYRAVTRAAWDRLTPDGSGYTIEYQSSIRAMKQRLTIAEFPTIEHPRADDQEGSPSLPTGLAFVKLFGSELLGRRSKGAAR